MPKPFSRNWAAASAWDVRPGCFGRRGGAAGVRMTFFDTIGLSTIIVQDGQHERFSAFVKSQWNFETPAMGRAAFQGSDGLVWSAPRQWLAVAPMPEDLDQLPVKLAGIAAVTEQGDGRSVVQLSGAAARECLQKGLAIDLDPVVFKKGDTAVAALAHLSVQIWQTDEEPAYCLAVGRSVSRTIAEWLESSAAEFGYEIILN